MGAPKRHSLVRLRFGRASNLLCRRGAGVGSFYPFARCCVICLLGAPPRRCRGTVQTLDSPPDIMRCHVATSRETMSISWSIFSHPQTSLIGVRVCAGFRRGSIIDIVIVACRRWVYVKRNPPPCCATKLCDNLLLSPLITNPSLSHPRAEPHPRPSAGSLAQGLTEIRAPSSRRLSSRYGKRAAAIRSPFFTALSNTARK